MSDPLGINQVDNELRTKIAAKSGSDNRAGNALANGNVGEGQYKVDASAKQAIQDNAPVVTDENQEENINPTDAYKEIAEEYKIPVEILYKFLHKIGYTDNEIFDEKNDYVRIVIFLRSVIESVTEKNENITTKELIQELNDISNNIVNDIENNNVTKELVASYYCEYSESENTEQFKKNITDKIDNSIKDLKREIAEELKIQVSEEDLYNFFSKIGYPKEKLYECNNFEGLRNIAYNVFKSTKDIKNPKVRKFQIEKISQNVKKALENHETTMYDVENNVALYINKDILTIMKELSPYIEDKKVQDKLKKVKSIKELSDSDMVEIVKAYFKSNGKNVNKGFSDFISILDIIIDTKDKDTYNKLYDAFKTFASQNEKLKNIFALSEALKTTDVDKLISVFLKNEQIKAFLEDKNITAAQIREFFIKVKDELNNDGRISQNVLQQLLEYIDTDGIIDKITELKNNPEAQKEGTPEYNQLKKYEELQAALFQIMQNCPKELQEKVLRQAEQANNINDIYNILDEISKQHPEYNIKEALDKLTNGAYSEYINKHEAEVKGDIGRNYIPAGSSENSQSSNVLGYSTASESTYTTALNNVNNLTGQLYVPEEEGITVESTPAKSQSKKNQPEVSQKTAASNSKYFDAAWSEGKIDIKYLAENFNTACAKGIQKVWNFLDRNQQNRLDYLNSWHNAELSSDAAKRYDMDDEEIEALNLSIGETQVLKNRHKQLHQHEEDRA